MEIPRRPEMLLIAMYPSPGDPSGWTSEVLTRPLGYQLFPKTSEVCVSFVILSLPAYPNILSMYQISSLRSRYRTQRYPVSVATSQ